MKRIATKDLSGPALDFAVALAEGYDWARQWREGMLCLAGPRRIVSLAPSGGDPLAPAAFCEVPHFSSRPEHGHPIIEREGIATRKHSSGTWYALARADAGDSQRVDWHELTWRGVSTKDGQRRQRFAGPTMLVAGLRCYVASKLGELVDVPEELVP